MYKAVLGSVCGLMLSVGAASALTVNGTDIYFNDGTTANLPGGVKTYTESGFTFTSGTGGGTLITNGQCIDGGCLQLNNNDVITLTYSGGTFDLNDLWYNNDGAGSGIAVSSNLNSTPIELSMFIPGQPFVFQDFGDSFTGVTSITFAQTGNGTSRIDDPFNGGPGGGTGEVPLPATGLLLLGGVGALVAKRRKASA